MNSRRCLRVPSLLFLLAVVAVRAGEPETRYFNIRAQPLDAALIEFSEQANVQLMISTELVENRRTMGVRGQYLPEDALVILIMGTGLTFHPVGENAIAVVRDDGV